MSEKRKRENEAEKPKCKYGEKCYRKNPIHLEAYSHPENPEQSQERKRTKVDDESKEGSSSLEDKSERMRNYVPFLLTKVRNISGRFNDSKIAVGLRDILSSKMGDLQASAQFNYMFDIPWLIEHYPADKRSKPLLIVHGDQREKKHQLQEEAEPFPNVRLFQAKLPIAYGTHHSKMMLLLYAEGLRVVITTANLIHADWDKKTQGVWISPLFPKYSQENQDEAGPEGSQFQKDLMDYLHQYGPGPLNEWRQHVAEHDMSNAKVRLLASVPGRHIGINKDKWGHMKLRKLLQQYGEFDDIDSWPVIGQFSSIGSLGPDKSKWLCSEWLRSLASTNSLTSLDHDPSLHLMFPTVENVRTSLEGYVAGGSLPYSWKTAAKQPYLKDFFCRWKSECLGRSRASPHLKSYTRISPDLTKAAWFIMTSANLSKAAWGALEKNGSQLMIRSYEIGVLFLPQDFDTSEKFFNLPENQAESNGVILRLPFDLPVVPYTNEDRPWLWDRQYSQPDVHGHRWNP
ncbi:tyrosyl-DNA phosphodiesterase 1-like [Paramuricea clavata]|uniref:Tyrosyl-DNA phosphodiesterase 1-like n=1 Tax=Paramuricea clavata TaxID=317549 RepID=A0A6S7HKD3_PARCT|nr:tyrosyl-DNA phosphodiesterase 1-like [Paramuricea clavata]